MIETDRLLIANIDEQFAKLYSLWCSLVTECPPDNIYKQIRIPANGIEAGSVGETVVRSAAIVEQTCGGITANLWDDPLEWTLPETLPNAESINEYLASVEVTRRRAFDSFKSDVDLSKQIAVPSGQVQTLASLLLQTLGRACQTYGEGVLMAKILFARNTSRFII